MTYPSRTSGQTTSDWLVGAVKSNPEGLLLLAAGCALLLRSGGSSGRPHYTGGASKAIGRAPATAAGAQKAWHPAWRTACPRRPTLLAAMLPILEKRSVTRPAPTPRPLATTPMRRAEPSSINPNGWSSRLVPQCRAQSAVCCRNSPSHWRSLDWRRVRPSPRHFPQLRSSGRRSVRPAKGFRRLPATSGRTLAGSVQGRCEAHGYCRRAWPQR